MSLISVYRVFKLGLTNLVRNFTLTIQATTMMAITLIIISIFILLNTFASITTDLIKQKIDLKVSFFDEVPEQEILDLQKQLERRPDVRKVEYISKSSALQIWQDRPIKEEVKMLVTAENNPLPRGLAIKAIDPNSISDIAAIFSQSKIQDKVSKVSTEDKEIKRVIQKLLGITQFTNRIGSLITVFFVFISILVIINTIKLTIFTRKDEIEIMRLVGASDFFIKTPFYTEVLFYSVIATIIAITLTWLGFRFLNPLVVNFLETSQQYISSILAQRWVMLTVINLTVAIVISILSTAFSMRRHLNI